MSSSFWRVLGCWLRIDRPRLTVRPIYRHQHGKGWENGMAWRLSSHWIPFSEDVKSGKSGVKEYSMRRHVKYDMLCPRKLNSCEDGLYTSIVYYLFVLRNTSSTSRCANPFGAVRLSSSSLPLSPRSLHYMGEQVRSASWRKFSSRQEAHLVCCSSPVIAM